MFLDLIFSSISTSQVLEALVNLVHIEDIHPSLHISYLINILPNPNNKKCKLNYKKCDLNLLYLDLITENISRFFVDSYNLQGSFDTLFS